MTETNEKSIIVGILGSLLPFDKSSEKIICDILTMAVMNLNNFKVAARFSNIGINKVVYNWAEKMGVQKIGIAPKCCWEYPCRMVNEVYLSGKEWGDESEKFSEICNAVIIINNKKIVENFLEKFREKDKQIIDISEEFSKLITQIN